VLERLNPAQYFAVKYITPVHVTAIFEILAYMPDVWTKRNIFEFIFFQNLHEQSKSWPLKNACIN